MLSSRLWTIFTTSPLTVRVTEKDEAVPARVARGVAYTPVVNDRVLVAFVSGRVYIIGAH